MLLHSELALEVEINQGGLERFRRGQPTRVRHPEGLATEARKPTRRVHDCHHGWPPSLESFTREKRPGPGACLLLHSQIGSHNPSTSVEEAIRGRTTDTGCVRYQVKGS